MTMTITMPALSPTMEEGTLARWLIKPGDAIRTGDIIAEIETDKATMELEAAEDGLICELVVPDGSEAVKVGAVIARLAGSAAEPAPVASLAAPSAAKSPNGGPSGSIAASPLARHVAGLMAIDLEKIAGAAPEKRIMMRDLVPAPRPTTALAGPGSNRPAPSAARRWSRRTASGPRAGPRPGCH